MARETEGSEDEVRNLNAMGNPEVQVRSFDGGREGVGPIGNTRPTGILARGERNREIASGRQGATENSRATERLRQIGGRPNR